MNFPASRFQFIFRTAECTFTIAERIFTTAERTFRSAEYKTKACPYQIGTGLIIKFGQSFQANTAKPFVQIQIAAEDSHILTQQEVIDVDEEDAMVIMSLEGVGKFLGIGKSTNTRGQQGEQFLQFCTVLDPVSFQYIDEIRLFQKTLQQICPVLIIRLNLLS